MWIEIRDYGKTVRKCLNLIVAYIIMHYLKGAISSAEWPLIFLFERRDTAISGD
jgi:hypothetical protein